MKIGLLGDIHIGARNDSEFFLQNTLHNLDHYIGEFRKAGVDTIIQLGDVFDRRKHINFSTLHKFRKHFLDNCRDFRIFCLIGNHDIYYKNSLEVNSLHCLLGEYGNITVVNEPTEVDFDGTSFLLLPWVAIDNKAQCVQAIRTSSAKVLCGHLEIKDIVTAMPFEDGFSANEFDRYPLVLSGHYHDSVNGGHIKYVGNISEITWSDCGGNKAAHVIDTSNLALDIIPEIKPVFSKIQYSEDFSLDDFPFGDYSDRICRIFVPEFDRISRVKFDLFVDMLSKISYTVEVVESGTSFFGQDTSSEVEFDSKTTNIIDLLTSHIDNIVQEQRIQNKAEMLDYAKELYQNAIDVLAEEVFE